MVDRSLKNTMHRFLRLLSASRGTKSKLAQAYYDLGVFGLVGKIDRMIPSSRRVAAMIAMIEILPAPDINDLGWLLDNHRVFKNVQSVLEAVSIHWVGSGFALCPTHGLVRISSSYDPLRGTTYDDDSFDLTVRIHASCGCDLRQAHYAHEEFPRPWELM